MKGTLRFTLAGSLALAVAACASGKTRASNGSSSSPDNSAFVVRGSELSGGNLLDGLRFRVPSMTVLPSDGCPRILFRGVRSVRNQGNPTVYVDGTRMVDTCILQQISTMDVDYVELYASGVTTRVGYDRSPFGLILVFRVRE